MFRLSPVAKHNGYGRKYLNIYVSIIAIIYPSNRIPTITFNDTKTLSIFHHTCSAF